MHESEDAIQKAKWQNWQETPASLSVFAMHDMRCTTYQSLKEEEGDILFPVSLHQRKQQMEKNP